VVDESEMIRNQIGTHRRYKMIAVARDALYDTTLKE
jgi:hypothetical protein